MGFCQLLKKASLAGAFFVPAIWLSAAQAQVFCPAPAALARVEVQRVVDGDTVRLKDGRSVRMIGINTPETGRKGRADEPFAVAARQRLQALVQASDGRVGLVPGREGKLELPDHVEVVVPIFQGGNPVQLTAKLRHRMDKGVVAFSLIVPSIDVKEREAFRAIGEAVAKDTETPVFYVA